MEAALPIIASIAASAIPAIVGGTATFFGEKIKGGSNDDAQKAILEQIARNRGPDQNLYNTGSNIFSINDNRPQQASAMTMMHGNYSPYTGMYAPYQGSGETYYDRQLTMENNRLQAENNRLVAKRDLEDALREHSSARKRHRGHDTYMSDATFQVPKERRFQGGFIQAGNAPAMAVSASRKRTLRSSIE